jgi:hypothetical protein
MQPDANGLKTSTQIATLTKLLQDLHQELKTCMEHKRRSGGVEGDEADPILLGDFVVDAYNSYLSSAKSTFDDPVIQTIPQIDMLGEVDYDLAQIRRVGDHPRLRKMHEVAFAARKLLIFLENAEKSEKARAESEMSGAITLIENLGEQIEKITELHAKMDMTNNFFQKEKNTDAGRLAQPLIDEYNRCLTVVLEASDDPVMSKLFRPLEYGKEDEKSFSYRIVELKLAQSGLLSYLEKKKHQKPWDSSAFKKQLEQMINTFKGKEGAVGPPFSDRVKKVMQLAREESARLGHNYIGSEHLLLGIIREGDGKAVTVLKNLGLNLQAVKQSIDVYFASSGGHGGKPEEAPFTPRAKQILEAARAEAKGMGSQIIGTGHMLLALLKHKDEAVAQILSPFGVDYKIAQGELVKLLKEQSRVSS